MTTLFFLKRDIKYHKKNFVLISFTSFFSGLLFSLLLLSANSLFFDSSFFRIGNKDIGNELKYLPAQTISLGAQSFILLDKEEDASSFLLSKCAKKNIDLELFIQSNKEPLNDSFSSLYKSNAIWQKSIISSVADSPIVDLKKSDIRFASKSDILWNGPNSLAKEKLDVLQPKKGECFIGSSIASQLKEAVLGKTIFIYLDGNSSPLSLKVKQIMLEEVSVIDRTIFLNFDQFKTEFSSVDEIGDFLFLIPNATLLSDFTNKKINSAKFLPYNLIYDSRIFESLDLIEESVIKESENIANSSKQFFEISNKQVAFLLFYIEIIIFIASIFIFVFLIFKGLQDRKSSIQQFNYLGFNLFFIKLELFLYYLFAFSFGLVALFLIYLFVIL